MGGKKVWLNLRYYPALLLQYAAGVAALSEGRHDVLNAVLTEPVLRSEQESTAVATSLHPMSVLSRDAWQLIEGWEKRHTPLNEHILGVVRKSELSRHVRMSRRVSESVRYVDSYTVRSPSASQSTTASESSPSRSASERERGFDIAFDSRSGPSLRPRNVESLRVRRITWA